ncbi:Nucleotidyltransferase [Hypoxylon crocopeplum]|nr:Nucleotidyltransferase [Hypoxylon crocopeplum]
MDPSRDRYSQNPNAATIDVLQDLATYYDQTKDRWRTLGYRKAIRTLVKQTTKIITKEAIRLPGIGESIATKIEEIVQTDGLRKFNYIRDDPKEKVLRLFLGVYDVGLAQASKWYQAGYRTLADLRAGSHATPLTANQIVGIEHYDDFAARIPRHEVAAHGEIVRTALRHLDPACSVTVMGFYRRGATDSGDIDLLISKPGAPSFMLRDIVFSQLLPHLASILFVKATLAGSGSKAGSKWHGASCLPDSTVWRRLDILLVPDTELGASLLYFTGNEVFNRSMRLLARRRGMRLNQYGLFGDVVRRGRAMRINDGTLIEAKDEKRIFEVLGVLWREPEERCC